MSPFRDLPRLRRNYGKVKVQVHFPVARKSLKPAQTEITPPKFTFPFLREDSTEVQGQSLAPSATNINGSARPTPLLKLMTDCLQL